MTRQDFGNKYGLSGPRIGLIDILRKENIEFCYLDSVLCIFFDDGIYHLKINQWIKPISFDECLSYIFSLQKGIIVHKEMEIIHNPEKVTLQETHILNYETIIATVSYIEEKYGSKN